MISASDVAQDVNVHEGAIKQYDVFKSKLPEVAQYVSQCQDASSGYVPVTMTRFRHVDCHAQSTATSSKVAPIGPRSDQASMFDSNVLQPDQPTFFQH